MATKGLTKTFWTLWLACACWAILHLAIGKTIPVGGGYGWDGLRYGTWARDFDTYVVKDGINTYDLGRVFPSLIVHFGLELSNADLSEEKKIENYYSINKNVIWGFRVYNLLLFIGSISLLLSCLQKARIEGWALVASLGTFVLTNAIIKDYFYQPVMTDQTGIFCGSLVLWGIVQKRPIAILIGALIGAFSWPTSLLLGMLAFILPSSFETIPSRQQNPRNTWLIASLLGVCLCGGVCWYLFLERIPDVYGIVPVENNLIPISLLFSFGWIVIGAYYFFRERSIIDWFALHKKTVWARVVIGFGAICLVIFAQRLLSNGEPFFLDADQTLPNDFHTFALYLFRDAIVRPLSFLVAHFAYFGVLIILLIIFWPSVVRSAGELGPQASIMLLVTLGQSLTSESRQMIFVFPLLAFLASKSLSRFNWNAINTMAYLSLCFILSKAWMPYSYFNLPDGLPKDHESLTFPIQAIMMNIGSWMNTEMYIIHLGTFFIAFAILLLAFRKKRISD